MKAGLAVPVGLALASLAALATACAGGPVTPELIVGAASSLEPVLREVGEIYEARTGARVTFVFGASGTIARQIEEGAPIDVFASADPAYMDRLAGRGLVDAGSVRSFGEGRLVVVAPFSVRGRADWTAPLRSGDKVRYIAIANPRTAPYGAAAVEALTSAALWEELEPKVVYGETVMHVLQLVRTGNADVGLVARSLVDAGLAEGLHVSDVDPSAYEPIAETVGIVSESRQQPLAARFVDALLDRSGL